MSLPAKKLTWRDYLDPNYSVPLLLLVSFAVFLVWAVLPDGLYDYDPSFLLPKNPLREPIFHAEKISLKGYELTPVRRYALNARLLAKHEYGASEDLAADLSPIDMYFGWEPMATNDVLQYLTIGVNQRAAVAPSWSLAPLHISIDELRLHSDNNHLIPSTPEIEKRLRSTPVGSLIHLEGYFVEVKNDSGFRWNTSLTYGWSGGILSPYKIMRTCKVIYVTAFDITP